MLSPTVTSKVLGFSFYARNAEIVAKELLGQTLVVNLNTSEKNNPEKRSRIVETEAYVGTHDLACHAAKGRTKRTETMFGEAGRAYIYLIYGMYDMLNIVTGKEGEAQAVLIRAVEPLNFAGDTQGPGKLCKVLGITRALNNEPLLGSKLWLEKGKAPTTITTTTRIGVAYAKEWQDAPLRFYDADSKWVSRK
jgi:DNA-3-methyladenine glycosylase